MQISKYRFDQLESPLSRQTKNIGYEEILLNKRYLIFLAQIYKIMANCYVTNIFFIHYRRKMKKKNININYLKQQNKN